MHNAQESDKILGNLPIQEGFISDLIAVDYKPIQNYRGKLTKPQIVEFNGEEYMVADVGETPHELNLIFLDRSLPVRKFLEAGLMSFIVDGDKCYNAETITNEQLANLIGKTFKCTHVMGGMLLYIKRGRAMPVAMKAYGFEILKANPLWN